MAEPYIKKLRNERAALIACLKAVKVWLAAVEVFNTTGRKGSAKQQVVRLEKEMDDALKSIEPLLAE